MITMFHIKEGVGTCSLYVFFPWFKKALKTYLDKMLLQSMQYEIVQVYVSRHIEHIYLIAH